MYRFRFAVMLVACLAALAAPAAAHETGGIWVETNFNGEYGYTARSPYGGAMHFEMTARSVAWSLGLDNMPSKDHFIFMVGGWTKNIGPLHLTPMAGIHNSSNSHPSEPNYADPLWEERKLPPAISENWRLAGALLADWWRLSGTVTVNTHKDVRLTVGFAPIWFKF